MRPQRKSLQYSLVQLFLEKIDSKSLINSIVQEIKTLWESPDIESEEEQSDSCSSELENYMSEAGPGVMENMVSNDGGRILDDFSTSAGPQ